MICPWHERLQLSSTLSGRNTHACSIGFGLYGLDSFSSVIGALPPLKVDSHAEDS